MTDAIYLRPDTNQPLLFGDVFSSDWLFDAFIHKDAIPIREIELSRGQGRGYAPVRTDGPQTERDFLLAHGKACRAILISDDCEIETCLIRKDGRGRLVFAAVSPWPEDPIEADKAAQMVTFRRHPLTPADGFDGGIVDLFRLFAVNGRALVNTQERLLTLGDNARAELEQRWAAFATRRGPLAATDNATKLAHVMDAKGDGERFEVLLRGDEMPNAAAQEAAKAVARTLIQGWRTEGEVMQKIADAHEAREAGNEQIGLLEGELRTLADFATKAADLVRAESGSS